MGHGKHGKLGLGKALDYREFAALAINHYEQMLDPDYHYLPYFFAKIGSDESFAWHSEWDFGDAVGRFLDASILCGEIIGKRIGREAEEHMKEALRWMQSESDGLFYRMSNEWGVPAGANMFDQRSVFLGLLSWHKFDQDVEALVRIERMLKGMRAIAVERDDYICYPFETYVPGMTVPEEIYTEHGFIVEPTHYGGGVFILPLAIYYERTGDPLAAEMLEKLTKFVVYHSKVFAEDGSFWSQARYPDDGHFHSKMGAVAGILRYANLTQDRTLIDWCQKVYDWACSMGSTYGWFPEGTGLNGEEPVVEKYRWLPGVIQHSETCCTTDMIHTAIYLAKNGNTGCWDDADRFANTLVASQVRDISWAKTMTDKEDTSTRTYRDVPARYRGGFTGRMNPNDFSNDGKVDTMACCCAAGGRGLHLVWDHATTWEQNERRLFVNIWLNKVNEDVRMEYGVPEEGVLCVTPMRSGDVYIRLPGWLKADEVKCRAPRGLAASAAVEAGYLVVKGLRAGETVALTFEPKLVLRAEVVAGKPYEGAWIGNRLFDVKPHGVMPMHGALVIELEEEE
ncbi:hypothetical protein [Paenibacillus albus]|uniref:Uncharacterized protein n=1 Tax=Paenibacillus albus TaxID=2495582 RepID=A0A3S9A1U4_9BACL|nr:hypothetical protein [Paenibacillus albus]AZN39709.1 hypothetical protein EJC50_08680 [Paenibacillus albus]